MLQIFKAKKSNVTRQLVIYIYIDLFTNYNVWICENLFYPTLHALDGLTEPEIDISCVCEINLC